MYKYILNQVICKVFKKQSYEELPNANIICSKKKKKKKRHTLFVKDFHRMTFNPGMLIHAKLPSYLQGGNH